MKILKRLLIFILSIVLFSGCSKNEAVAPERFFDFHNYTMRLLTGEKQTFELRESITNYPFSAIKFESLDEGIVKILDDRTIQSIAPGTTAVKAMLDNRELDRFTVIIVDGVVTGISLVPAMTTLKQGQTLQLNPVITPFVAKDKSVVWSSSDSTIANVNQNGMIIAIKPGDATVSVVTATNLTVKCIIKVVQ
ncbi:Ig-like domain-containing protein [Pedobacter aquatilis]|uniref:Ig-like domain-containing protein n=1 Tax=Pedobacter aquatilis TaxID=351343 RepID=UPI00292E9003|nr:Ig-like domain-containing protein [Pedobacter aquatilis]